MIGKGYSVRGPAGRRLAASAPPCHHLGSAWVPVLAVALVLAVAAGRVSALVHRWRHCAEDPHRQQGQPGAYTRVMNVSAASATVPIAVQAFVQSVLPAARATLAGSRRITGTSLDEIASPNCRRKVPRLRYASATGS